MPVGSGAWAHKNHLSVLKTARITFHPNITVALTTLYAASNDKMEELCRVEVPSRA
jgi:hypothetical protein